MKKYILFIIVAIMSFGCGDYLDVVPDNVATIEHAFKDRTSTLRYLATCYHKVASEQNISKNVNQIGSDEFYVDQNPFYGGYDNWKGLDMRAGYQDSESPMFNLWGLYDVIRDCNTFIENAPSVTVDITETEKATWIAEVKVLKAYYHFRLMRMYGPMPIIKENISVDGRIEDSRVSRDPYDESIEYLVSLIDEAMEFLPEQINNLATEAGHITKPVAAAIKADMLLTAASPLYNGNTDLATLKNNDGTQLVSTEFDPNKWTLAAEAAKQALDYALNAGHDFYETFEFPDISDSTKTILNRKQCVIERWNKEIIWAKTDYNIGAVTAVTPYFSLAMHDWAPFETFISPTLATTEFFYSSNGVPIDEDNMWPYEDRHQIAVADESEKYYVKPNYETMQIHLKREPRYYANLGFDGARWFGNGRFKEIGRGANPGEESYLFQMKAKQQQGKAVTVRFSATGLYCRKLVHYKSAYTAADKNVTQSGTFAIYRLAELYLMYAEALNESLDAPNAEVYAAIDAVRQQAGLNGVVESWTNHSKFPGKVTTKEGMREIIRAERTSELAFEGSRYDDIRRWKTATAAMNEPIRGYDVDSEAAIDFNQIMILQSQRFYSRDYFLPIKQEYIRKNDNLVQNPLW